MAHWGAVVKKKNAETLKPLVSWHAKPCSLVNTHRRFRVTCYLHQQGKLNEISHSRGEESSIVTLIKTLTLKV